MLPEQQQRIMGYFIEEAKDHLNTIEQGLLSLQATIEDPEKANEIFRAAHSVKGGAAMLGLESIQKTAHRMEDYFKILKEASVQVDQLLETMFLRVSDGLKDLLEQLEGPFGLTPDKAQEIMADVEPVFEQLEAHLNGLVTRFGGASTNASISSTTSGTFTPEAVQTRFKRDVAGLLRKMLATFKQPDNAETRKVIQDICAQLMAIGEQFELATWCDLIETARLAADSAGNDYRALAPVLIKEIKKAQDLVLSGRASEVSVCDALQALLPEDILATEADDLADLDLDYELAGSLSDLDLKVEETNVPTDGSREDSVAEVGLESLFDESVDASEVASISPAETKDDFEGLFDDNLETGDSGASDAIAHELGADSAETDGLTPEANAQHEALSENALFGTLVDNENGLEDPTGEPAEEPIGRLSLDLDFDEIPSELSTLNRNAESEEKADESLDALLATVNVTGPDVGTEELNSLADLFDGDLDELDNTLGGHAFVTEEMQLNPEKIDLSPEDDLGDLLTGGEFVGTSSAEEINDEIDDDLFGGTLTDGEFAVALSSDLTELDEATTETVPNESALPQPSTDLSDLSDDLWADDTDEDLFGTGSDALSFELSEIDSLDAGSSDLDSSITDNSDLNNLGPDLSDVSDATLDILELGVPEIELSALDNSVLDSSVNELDLDALNLDALDSSTLSTSESTRRDQKGNQASHTVSPRELDIEFPTLTGVKLEKAEQSIDSFFLDDKDEAFIEDDDISDDGFLLNGELEVDTSDSSLSEAFSSKTFSESETSDEGDQLADNPWGELPIEATLTGVEDSSVDIELTDQNQMEPDRELAGLDWTDEPAPDNVSFDNDRTVSSDVELGSGALEPDFLEGTPNDALEMNLNVEQASSGLDELLEAAIEQESDTTPLSTEPNSDDLWDDLVSSSETTDNSQSDFLSVDFDSELSIENDLDKLTSVATIDEVGTDKDIDEQTDTLISDHRDVSGDELSEEILADFATAFGIETASVDLLEEVAAEEASAEKNETDNDVWNKQASEDLLPDNTADSFAVDGFAADSSQAEAEIEELPTLGGIANESMNGAFDAPSFGDSSATAVDSIDNLGTDQLELDSLDIDSLFEIDDSNTEHGDGGTAAQGSSAAKGVCESDGTDDFFESEALDLAFDQHLDSSSDVEKGADSKLDGFLTEDELAALEDEEELPQDSALEEESNAAFDEAFDFDTSSSFSTEDDFGDLESLLAEDVVEEKDSMEAVGDMPTFVGVEDTLGTAVVSEDEDFGDLERLLDDVPSDTTPAPQQRVAQRSAVRRSGGGSGGGLREQNMRVSVSHLDTLSNLVGELVVSRNTLERDQERLRQFLDNLLFQVQQLNDVGQRMRDLYERSLLESSLMSNRIAHSTQGNQTADPADVEDHATGETFDALEMDRFTGFHTLSQEMIELIVRVRESSSDIGYTVESSDQVTRQFRQITTQLQEGLNTARMVAFSQAADRLPRAVRDISLKCGKEARLIVEGQDTLIDKMIVEHLYDPLTHLVNNAITHGVETPEKRKAAGKLSEGAITVRAFYQGNQTVIYVADDGGGINTKFVKQKAIEKHLITQAEAEGLSDIETYDLLFHPGFSTRDQADDFAGRGVGMDVVRTSLAEIRGSVTIDSELGKGTSFTIRLPLTLSISKALSCVSNQARIAFPMDGVEDMLDVPRDRIVQNEQGQDCVRWRDKLLTFQPVTELLKFNRTLGRGRVYGGGQDDDVLSIIVLRSANTYIAVQVDQVIGEQEIVIKQLEGPVPKPLGIAGATILGDGRVMPIADVLELIDIATGRVRRESSSMLWAQDTAQVTEESSTKQDPTVLIVDDSITVRELLSMSFNKVGYRVEQARDGQEAWDKLRSGLPCDLVFCDIEMPRMDGLELLSRMQKDNHLKRIPIAMLTSRGADRHRQMAVDLGASGYFTKPYLEEALLDAAQRMLNGETLAKGRGG